MGVEPRAKELRQRSDRHEGRPYSSRILFLHIFWVPEIASLHASALACVCLCVSVSMRARVGGISVGVLTQRWKNTILQKMNPTAHLQLYTKHCHIYTYVHVN